jgi:hypothetical protein
MDLESENTKMFFFDELENEITRWGIETKGR